MIVALVQARLNSTRLPGKVLKEINGKPLLRFLTERLAQCSGVDLIVCLVPLSDHFTILEAAGNEHHILLCYPIEENDVWLRYRLALKQIGGAETFIRICADSPLIDPSLIDWMIEQHEGGITCNTHPRTFPAGQCIEIIDTDVFLSGKPETAYDREHVTPWYYRNCKYKNVECPLGDFSKHSMVVDTQDDFDRMETLMGKMQRPAWTYGWRELVEMMQ